MTSTRTVSIAGAGLAGLAAAAALAQRGFEVTIYERSSNPREFGAGIYMKDNSLPVLDALGVGPRIERNSCRLRNAMIIDERQEVIVNRDVSGERLIVVTRTELHNALRDAALDAGAKLMTGMTVTAARPDGTLLFDDGRQVTADLVVAADGVRSPIRESLGLTKSYRALEDGATRLLVPRREEPVSCEYWSGPRRVGVAPCSGELSYVFLIGPENHPRCGAVPVDREYWTAAYPHLAELFQRIPDDAGVHHRHEEVTCIRWTAGRVAIIGDAAHAQPPNFGQGAGLAVVAAWELARTVADAGYLPAQLADWERRVRPAVDTVQQLTTLYSHVGYWWPAPALAARSKMFHWLSVLPVTGHAWQYWWRGGCEAPLPYTDPSSGCEGSAG